MKQKELIMKSPILSAADEKYDTDIVIAGGGLSGLSAALTAAESGVKAIVLEKMHFLGGAGLFPEGSLGIGTRFQKENGIRTTTDEVFAKAAEGSASSFALSSGRIAVRSIIQIDLARTSNGV